MPSAAFTASGGEITRTPRPPTQDARLYGKGRGKEAKPRHTGDLLMENRSGLIVDTLVTEASGTAERDAAEVMLGRRPGLPSRYPRWRQAYDAAGFVAGLRALNVTPHVA